MCQSTFCTPVDMMASRCKTWVANWQKTLDSSQDTVMVIQEVRACAKTDQDLTKIELKDRDEALSTMNEATGLGADFGSSNLCQKMVDRNLSISLTNVRNRLRGPGRCTLQWYACLPRR